MVAEATDFDVSDILGLGLGLGLGLLIGMVDYGEKASMEENRGGLGWL